MKRLSWPTMTKHPSTPASPPPPKQPSTSRRLEAPPPLENPPLLDTTTLKDMCKNLCFKMNKKGVTKENFKYQAVYWKVHETYKWFVTDIDEYLVDEKTFTTNVEFQQDNFFSVLKRGLAKDVSLADMKAVISHSMCFCFRVNQLWTFVPKVCLGWRHPSLIVSSQTYKLKTDQSIPFSWASIRACPMGITGEG